MNIAEVVAKQKGMLRKSKVGKRVLRRQDDLLFQRGNNTSNVRMAMKIPIPIIFVLKKPLQENGLINSPERIYNVDKTGVPLDPKAPNVVTRKGTKMV